MEERDIYGKSVLLIRLHEKAPGFRGLVSFSRK